MPLWRALLACCIVVALADSAVVSAVRRRGVFEESFDPPYGVVKEDMAFFEVLFDQPVHFAPPGTICPTNNACADTNWGTCCNVCNGALPAPGQPAGCVCASLPGAVCIDGRPKIFTCTSSLVRAFCVTPVCATL